MRVIPLSPGTPRTGRPIRIDGSLLTFLAVVAIVIAAVHEAEEARYDFGVFYYAARMVWDGARTSLYDLNAQHTFQLRYGRPPDLFFYYPAFVLLPFLPLAVLPLRIAFVLWTVLSISLLTIAVRSLSLRAGLRYDNWPILLSAAFIPVASNLANGQLSIVVLAAYVWCWTLWSEGRRFTGGMVLALAAVKFQLVAGFLLVLLFKRRWREIAGFALVCIPLVLVSEMIVGAQGLKQYPAFLLQCERGPGVDPTMMANLRGLAALFFGKGSHIGVVAALSLVALLFATMLWKDLDRGFAAAIVATMLVSYHFNPQDLSLLLIPLFLSTRRCAPSTVMVVAFAALALPMAPAVAGGRYFALLAIPLSSMLFWIRSWNRKPFSAVSPSGDQRA